MPDDQAQDKPQPKQPEPDWDALERAAKKRRDKLYKAAAARIRALLVSDVEARLGGISDDAWNEAERKDAEGSDNAAP